MKTGIPPPISDLHSCVDSIQRASMKLTGKINISDWPRDSEEKLMKNKAKHFVLWPWLSCKLSSSEISMIIPEKYWGLFGCVLFSLQKLLSWHKIFIEWLVRNILICQLLPKKKKGAKLAGTELSGLSILLVLTLPWIGNSVRPGHVPVSVSLTLNTYFWIKGDKRKEEEKKSKERKRGKKRHSFYSRALEMPNGIWVEESNVSLRCRDKCLFNFHTMYTNCFLLR